MSDDAVTEQTPEVEPPEVEEVAPTSGVEEVAQPSGVEEVAPTSGVEEVAQQPSRNPDEADEVAQPPGVEEVAQPSGVEEVAQQPSRNPEEENGLGDDLTLVQADAARAQADVAALTSDLQRLQAEYLNYKRRVDRDRDLVRDNATYAALAPITEVLDTIDRAREHGPLEEGLRAVAEQLERVVAGLGLVKFGAPGDAFDPMVHEALSHIGEDPEVTVTTCKVVARSGYRLGERVVRAAQVLVVDPSAPAAADDPGSDGPPPSD